MNRHLLSSTFIAVTLFVAGCSTYQSGSLMHPQFQSVWTAPIENNSLVTEIDTDLRTAMNEKLMRDGSLTIATKASADAHIKIRIIDVNTHAVASAKKREHTDTTRDNYQTSIYGVDLVLEVALIKPGRAKPVINWTQVTGSATYFNFPDMAESRRQGLKEAVEDAAQKAVTTVTEAW